MTQNLIKLSKEAAEIILSHPKATRIRVISHYDADGITAAAIISKALQRTGYDFHTSLMRNPFDKGLEKVSKEKNKLIIFTDMGSGQINAIEKMKVKSIIIDHHQVKKEKTGKDILQINANLCGINGNYEACGATLAYSLAIAIDPKNKDLAALAMAGATGDKQYIGKIRGYNKTILENAVNDGILKEETEIKLSDSSISDALFYTVDPYYSGLSGNKEKINEVLEKLNISKDVKFKDLSEDKKTKLRSYLLFLLIKNGCEKNILDTVIRPRYFSESLGSELESFADLLDSCGKGGNRGLGLAICLDDKDLGKEAKKLEKDYKQEILDELLRLEKDGFEEKESFRYFYAKDSSLGGVIGGIATNFMLDTKKPLLSLVKNKEELHVSCRGTQYLVKNGLDLGSAMSKVAKKLNGHGGGHAIASGATIDLDKEEDFLSEVDKIISEQLKGLK